MMTRKNNFVMRESNDNIDAKNVRMWYFFKLALQMK